MEWNEHEMRQKYMMTSERWNKIKFEYEYFAAHSIQSIFSLSNLVVIVYFFHFFLH